MARINELKLERDLVKSKGKEYYNYFVSCEVSGRKSKARIIPKDNGGYSLLDILFVKANSEKITLVRKVTRNTNANGQVTVTVGYTALYVENEDGEIFEVAVKPYRSSDEDWIKMHIAEHLKTTETTDDGETDQDAGHEVHDDE